MLALSDIDKLVIDSPELGCALYVPGLPGGSNKIHNRSPYGNAGTIVGAAWKRLPSGLWYLLFDGTDDRINLPDVSALRPSEFTAIAWIRTSQEATARIIANFDRLPTANEKGFMFTLRNISGTDYTIVCQIDGSSGVPAGGIADFTVVNDDVWHQIAVIHEGTTNTYYVDGIVQPRTATVDNAVTYHSTSYPTIGANYNTELAGGYRRFFSGDIALVRIFNRPLYGTVIQNYFQQEKHLFGVW